MKTLVKISLIAVVMMTAISCNKDLLDKAPYDRVSSGNMWKTESNADFGVNGIYSVTHLSFCGSEVHEVEMFAATSSYGAIQPYYSGSATSRDQIFINAWKNLYEGVARANDAIDNLEQVPMDKVKIHRLMCESKFLRAYYYTLLNTYFRGVPLYLTTTDVQDFNKARNTEVEVWDAVIADLTDCIEEPDFPVKYTAGDPLFGRATKGAAYSLRGIAYLWKKDWAKAEADLLKVTQCGYALYDGPLKDMFRAKNEQCPEMIFSVQCTSESVSHGNQLQLKYAPRNGYGSGMTNMMPNTDFIDTYTYADGRPFRWDEIFPDWNSISPKERAAYFLRDDMTASEKNTMAGKGYDLSRWIGVGNEARLKPAYENRDGRLQSFFIMPYSTFFGGNQGTGLEYTHTYRYPYRKDTAEPFDLRMNYKDYFYYTYRKYVAEGAHEIIDRSMCDFDVPVIRYANVLLKLAEALNEQGKTDEAVKYVNMVRARAGVAGLNTNQYTQVKDQTDMRKRIQQEVRWEFCGEGVTFYDELRWGTYKEAKFFEGAGRKQPWDEAIHTYLYLPCIERFPIPQSEIEMNPNLEQNPGWIS